MLQSCPVPSFRPFQWLAELLSILLIIAMWLPFLMMPTGTIWHDGAMYLLNASYVLNGYDAELWLSTFRPPLFSALIAAAFRLGGTSIATAGLVVKASILLCALGMYGIGRRLHGHLAGLLSVAVLTQAPYFLYLVQDIKLDSMLAGLMLASLTLFLAARDKEARGYFRRANALLAFSGFSLGLAFLVKETALIWFPLALIVVLFSSVPRCKRRLWHVGVVYGSFALAVGGWFLFYCHRTGKVFLIDIDARKLLLPVALLLGSGVVLVSGIIIADHIVRLEQWKRVRGRTIAAFQWLAAQPRFLGFFVFALSNLAMTAAFVPAGQPITMWLDVPRRFAMMPVFFQTQVFGWQQPLLPLAMATWPLIVLLAVRRKRYRILVLATVQHLPLLFLVASPSYGRWWTPRQIIVLYCVFYIGLGLVSAEAYHFLVNKLVVVTKSKDQGRIARTLALGLAAATVSLVSVWQSTTSVRAYDRDPFEGTMFGYEVQDAAAWLRENVPPRTGIMVAEAYAHSIQFLTQSRHYRYAYMPISSESTMERREDKWYLDHSESPGIEIAYPLYVRDYSADPPRFLAVPLPDLLRDIELYNVEYLILRFEDDRWAFAEDMRFFQDSPLFERIYYSASTDKQHSLRVYRVQPANDNKLLLDYPTTLHKQSVELWRQRLTTGENAPYNEYEFFRALGKRGILIEGDSPEQFHVYVYIGDVFAGSQDWGLACFEYRMALQADPAKADQILALAQNMIASQPSEGAAWVLLGDTYRVLGDVELARDAYGRAMQTPALGAEALSAAHRGLGQLLSAAGEHQQAIQEFARSLQLSILGAAETRKLLAIVRASAYQVAGNIDQALLEYRIALYAGLEAPARPGPEPFEALSFDFVRQFDRAESLLAPQRDVHPAVFVVGGRPRPVLYAHPPAWVSYTVQIPAKASLRFAPVIAPEAWRLAKGDGVRFAIGLETDSGTRSRLYSGYFDPKNVLAHREWVENQVDLSPWSGQAVTLVFHTGPGPNDDPRFDWAGWGALRIVQPTAYDFLESLAEADLSAPDPGWARIRTQAIQHETRSVLFQRPPSQVIYSLTLPPQPALYFGLGIDPAVWSPGKGDGVEYNVYVRVHDDLSRLYRVFHCYMDPKNDPADRRWVDERVDLSRFGGQEVEIIFEALPGPAGDANDDWGGWSTPVLVDETLDKEAGIGLSVSSRDGH